MADSPQEQLLRSWDANASAWSDVVARSAIPSRTQGTDCAVVEAVTALRPRSVLDLGCGEGWLARALSEAGIEVVGVDASAALVERAMAGGGGTFHVRSYAEIAADPGSIGRNFGAIVCNFALLQEDLVPVLRALRSCLSPRGVLVIQTLHPWTARGDRSYRDEWRTETFAAFGNGFTEPMPWYYRTLGSWSDLLQASGYAIAALREPPHPETGEPLSLLIIAAPLRETDLPRESAES